MSAWGRVLQRLQGGEDFADVLADMKVTALRRSYGAIHGRRFAAFGRNSAIAKPRMLRGRRFIEVGPDVFIREGARIDVVRVAGSKEPSLSIGRGTWIELDVQLSCVDRVSIGEDVLFGGRVFVTDNDHGHRAGTHRLSQPLETAPVRIGNRVWVGQNACILRGVTLGDDSVVAAGAIVTHSFPECTVVAGVPARAIGTIE